MKLSSYYKLKVLYSVIYTFLFLSFIGEFRYFIDNRDRSKSIFIRIVYY